MLIVIKSSPDTPEGKRGVSLARQTGADVVLVQDAVRFAAKEPFEGLQTGGKVYLLEEDASRLAGSTETASEAIIASGAIRINYDAFVDLLASENKVQGMF